MDINLPTMHVTWHLLQSVASEALDFDLGVLNWDLCYPHVQVLKDQVLDAVQCFVGCQLSCPKLRACLHLPVDLGGFFARGFTLFAKVCTFWIQK